MACPHPNQGVADPVFFNAYRAGQPPWDIGRAQPAFVELAEAGQIQGSVLDVGCGTGDNVLEMAERGHEAWGIDIVPMAIDQAKAKARLRGLEATFLVGDAMELHCLERTFDTVLDCGFFHGLSDAERQLYELELEAVSRPGTVLHLMAMSDWEDPSWGGPRRVSQQDVADTFGQGWRIDDIQQARFVTLIPRLKAHAWLCTIVREAPPTKRKPKRKTAKPPLATATTPTPAATPAPRKQAVATH